MNAMSEYERQSIDIAEQTLRVYFWGDIIAAGALFAVIIGGIVAFYTLRAIRKQLESAKWNSLLSFEADMAARRDRFTDLARELGATETKPGLSERYNAAKENYLNAVERLASSILNGQFPALEMKQSYREFMASVIRDFPDSFRTGTIYRKTVQLHDKWSD